MNSFLALDLAITTGWAAASICPPNPNVQIQSGVQEFAINSRIEGAGMRYLRFSRWLDEMHRLLHLERLSFEEVKQRPLSVAAGHMYGGFMATLTAWCESNNVPYEGIPVGTIKKHATGKGNAGKEEVKKAMRAKGHSPSDDNEADALAQLYLVLENATPSAPRLRFTPHSVDTGRVPVGPVPVARRRIQT